MLGIEIEKNILSLTFLNMVSWSIVPISWYPISGYRITDGLMFMFKVQQIAENWRLFIDSSKSSIKAVLLHNENMYASIPVDHSVHLKETYCNLALIFDKLNYKKFDLTVSGDLKVISMILGKQGTQNYPVFFVNGIVVLKLNTGTRKCGLKEH